MIEEYHFGSITIDGRTYTNDVEVRWTPKESKAPLEASLEVLEWWRKEGHSLHPEDLEEVTEASPEVLVVGTGAYGRMSVPRKVREHMDSNGIELVAEKTESACETYNELADEKEAVAALHLTC